MKEYNKNFAIKEMKKMIKAKNKILKLQYQTITELAKYLGVRTNSLYQLFKAKTGKSWKEVMPIQVIIRKTDGLRRENVI